MTAPRGRILVVAGSDSGGGAGVQADLRTIARLGGFGMSAITAITAQNTLGVARMHSLPADLVAEQMNVVLSDLGADAVKIGMLADGPIVEAVSAVLDSPVGAGIPLVLDTVIRSSSGATLLDSEGVAILSRRLVPRAALVTPNLSEAEILTGLPVIDLPSMERAAAALLDRGAGAVLVKGGHLPGESLVDLLVWSEGRAEFRHSRIPQRHTHGTGCTLAAAIATYLAQGTTLVTAVAQAIEYLQVAIHNAPGFGRGVGPLG